MFFYKNAKPFKKDIGIYFFAEKQVKTQNYLFPFTPKRSVDQCGKINKIFNIAKKCPDFSVENSSLKSVLFREKT